MRILHIIASADPRSGGPIEGILQQERGFNGAVASELVTLDAPNADFLKDFPLRIFPLGTGSVSQRSKPLPFRYGFSFKYLNWVRKHATQYDVVVVHGLWNFATMAAALVLPTAMRDKYYVYPHGMLDPWFAKSNPSKHLLKRFSWLGFEGRLVARARAVLFTAPEEARLAQGQFWGWSYKTAVIGYGISAPPGDTPLQRSAFRERIPGLGGRDFLLFLSRIHQKKGCDLLVRAYAQLAGKYPNIDLVIAGPDEENIVPALKELALTLNVKDRIHWPGMLTGDAKWGAFREANAFILPSHQENFGIVIAEALACEKAVLTTNKVNIWEDIESSGAGIVRNDHVEGVRDLIDLWLSSSSAEKVKMSASARRLFEEKFSVQYVTRRFMRLLTE